MIKRINLSTGFEIKQCDSSVFILYRSYYERCALSVTQVSLTSSGSIFSIGQGNSVGQ